MKIPKTLFAFIWHFVQKQRGGFFIILLTSLIWSTNEVLFPYFLKIIINDVTYFTGIRTYIYSILAYPLLALVTIWVFMDIAMRFQGFMLMKVFPLFRASIRTSVFAYVKQHSHQYFSDNFAGSIAKKMSDLPTSCQTLVEIFCFCFAPIILGFSIALILMYLAKPLFAGILLLWFCLHMGVTLIFLGIGNKRWSIHSEAVASLSGKIVDVLTNITNVRIFSNAAYEQQYLQTFQKEEIKKAKSAMFNIELLRICQGIFGLGLIFSMVFTLIHGWVNHWVSVGDFSLIAMLSFWMLGMVWFMSYQMGVFVREVGTVNEALSLIGVQHEIIDHPKSMQLRVVKGSILFENVQFAYQSINIFEKFNVFIPGGQRVGLVGFSGSGKSTFINLILRLYDLEAGQILIDDQDIAKVSQSSLRQQIAMIPQDPSLFHRTLMENIRYGRLDATDEEVIEASKLSYCHDFIQILDEGYQSLVGERGIKLSGGQRQRIAIARAILKNAPILILDEATSSLDSVTEKVIQKSLDYLMKDRTTIVIAHRLSTLKDMDRILVFHEGKIIEDGTQDALLKAGGHFAHLWNMQTNGFLPEE